MDYTEKCNSCVKAGHLINQGITFACSDEVCDFQPFIPPATTTTSAGVWRITWEDFDLMVREIVKEISKSGIHVDYVVGIPRGGLPLAVTLSHHLNVPFMIPGPGFDYQQAADKSVLIVDDISDTGQEMRQQVLAASRVCKKVQTVALIEREGTMQPVTYKGWHIQKTSGWIIFPWERYDEVGRQKEFPTIDREDRCKQCSVGQSLKVRALQSCDSVFDAAIDFRDSITQCKQKCIFQKER